MFSLNSFSFAAPDEPAGGTSHATAELGALAELETIWQPWSDPEPARTNLSLVNGEMDNHPKPKAFPLAALHNLLLHHAPRDAKDGSRAWIPATFAPGETRSNKAVKHITCVVFDFDTGKMPGPFRKVWNSLGLHYIVYSTFSHSPDWPKWRAVFPLEYAVPADQWTEIWARAAVKLGCGEIDRSCKDRCRLYYLPCCPEESLANAFAYSQPGVLLDPWSLPALEPASATAAKEGVAEHVKARKRTENRPTGSSAADPEVLLIRALNGDHNQGEGRNTGGFWLATQLRDNGHTESEARRWLEEYALRTGPTNTKGEIEPYTVEHALNSLRSAFSQPPREGFAPRRPQSPPVAMGEPASLPLSLRIDAQPPWQKLMELRESSRKAKGSFDRTRADLKDDRPTTFDLSIAGIAVRCGWPDQEIADTLIHNRVRHGDPDVAELIAKGYFQETIHKARSGVPSPNVSDAIDRMVAQQGQPDPGKDAVQAARAELRTVLGFPIQRVICYAAGENVTDQTYFVETEDGTQIRIGKINVLHTKNLFDMWMLAAVRRPLPVLKGHNWVAVKLALQTLVETVESDPDDGDRGQTLAWVQQYLEHKTPYKNNPKTFWQTAASRDPFYKSDGRVRIFVDRLQQYLSRHQFFNIEPKLLRQRLREIGAKSEKITYTRPATRGGGDTSLSAYLLPEEFNMTPAMDDEEE